MLVLTSFLIMSVAPIPWGIAAYGRQMMTYGNQVPGIVAEKDIPPGSQGTYCVYMDEGLNGTVCRHA